MITMSVLKNIHDEMMVIASSDIKIQTESRESSIKF